MPFATPQVLFSDANRADLNYCDEKPTSAWHWEVTPSLLYWTGHENRLQYTTEAAPVDTTTDFTTGNKVSPHFEWNLGFRVGLVYLPSSDSYLDPWYFNVEWTSILNKAKGDRETDGTEGIFPVQSLLPDTTSSDFVFKAHTRIDVHLNAAEATAVYRYQPLSFFGFYPYIGLKSAWIDQLIKTRYEGGSLIAGSEKIKMRNDSFGIGPEIGLMPFFVFSHRWKSYHQWKIYFFGSYAPLISWFRLKQKDEYAINSFHRNKDFCKVRSTIDAGLGLEWLTSFSRDRYALGLRAGYEYHIYFAQNLLKGGDLNLISGNKNLTFRGWIFSIKFGF